MAWTRGKKTPTTGQDIVKRTRLEKEALAKKTKNQSSHRHRFQLYLQSFLLTGIRKDE